METQITVKDCGLGSNFAVLTDSDNLVYQLGALPTEHLEPNIIKQVHGIALNNLGCGYDFVVGYGYDSSNLQLKLSKSNTVSDFRLS